RQRTYADTVKDSKNSSSSTNKPSNPDKGKGRDIPLEDKSLNGSMHAPHKKTVTYEDNANSNLHNYFKELGEQIKLLTQSMALLSHEVQAIKIELSDNSKNINTLFKREHAVFEHLQHPNQP